MARRNDHTHEELKILAIQAGKKIIAKEGFGKFSARKVAREIGYTIGTIYNIFESHDHLILCINATTLDDLNVYVSENINLSDNSTKTIKNLAESYIRFASMNYNSWSALFEHSLPKETALPEWYGVKLRELYLLIEQPLYSIFGSDKRGAEQTAQIIWAGVHGICQLGLSGKLDLEQLDLIINLSNNLVENYLRGITRDSELRGKTTFF